MTDKKLEAFKIGDTQRAGVSKATKATEPDNQSQSETHSLGFRRIETILESDDVAAVGDSLNGLLQKLEVFQGSATDNKDKAAAKKAIIAVERTADLLDYLFQTKTSMQSTT